MGAEVRLLSGRKIDWNNPPKNNAKCKLTLNDHTYTAGFRTLCHLNKTNNMALKRFDTGLTILQPPFNTTVRLSAGTHDLDCCWDVWINGVNGWTQQKFLRGLGWADWYRHNPLFGNHQHMFTIPPRRGRVIGDDFRNAKLKVGLFIDGGWSTRGMKVTSSQLEDYYNHAFGLANQHEKNSDTSWFPPDIEATIFDLSAYIARRAKQQNARAA